MIKKDKCIFTIVRNEAFFLPLWLKYYSKFFGKEDIYILDHSSDDGSTSGLDCQVEVISHDIIFHHDWLRNVVQEKQARLLDEYECVVFAEADEILYSLEYPLDLLIDEFKKSESNYVTCVGFELTQKVGEEKPYENGKPYMEDRSFWVKHHMYDKTLITKIPLSYVVGFHSTNYPNIYNYGLHMLHMHKLDFDTSLKRHESRIKDCKLDQASGGENNKTYDRNEVLKYFTEHSPRMVNIPEDHKAHLYSLLGS